MTDFTYQEGAALTWAQMNENLRLMQAKYLDSANSAAIAIAAANFKGNWSALTGALAVPAAVYHSSKFWLLLSSLADVTAATPGVSGAWAELDLLGRVAKSGDTMTGALNLPSNGLAVGTNQLVVSGGSVGIGVSPETKFHVQGGRSTLSANSEAFALQLNNGPLRNGPFLGSAGAEIFVVSTSAGIEVLRTDASRNVLVTGSGGLGYGVGSGGQAIQPTSKTSPVTLNKPFGVITMFSALGASEDVVFQVNNSLVGVDDIIALTMKTAVLQSASIEADCGAAGFFRVRAKNLTGSALGVALTFKFAIIKGAGA